MPNQAEKQYGSQRTNNKQRDKIHKEKEYIRIGEHVKHKDPTATEARNDNNMIFSVKIIMNTNHASYFCEDWTAYALFLYSWRNPCQFLEMKWMPSAFESCQTSSHFLVLFIQFAAFEMSYSKCRCGSVKKKCSSFYFY